MKTVCETDKCTGCMACLDTCPKGAVSLIDSLSAYNMEIDEGKCIHCNLCYNVCQNNNPPIFKEPFQWNQGWSNNEELRRNSSSGGFATAIASAFIKNGGLVCSCTFIEGKFGFEFVDNVAELKKFAGSKYVKSNPLGAYIEIKRSIKKGKKVLFIGLPCQVAAVKNYVGQDNDLLFTIDLICHGTPSPKLLELFLNQYNYSLNQINDIGFRDGINYVLQINNQSITGVDRVSDRYSLAFVNSLICTENCYSCSYAKKERVSDLTLGDSWGNELSLDEKKKGVSLVLCLTEKGKELLDLSDIHLENVDLNRAIENNRQLSTPSIAPKGRKRFFKKIKSKKFNSCILHSLPKQCIKQDIKKILVKMKII